MIHVIKNWAKDIGLKVFIKNKPYLDKQLTVDHFIISLNLTIGIQSHERQTDISDIQIK